MKLPKEGANRGNAGKGRRKGTPNRTTALIKDAIVRAAIAVGSDGDGAGGMQGYCEFLAKAEPKAFAGLMGKVLPTQITGDTESGSVIFNTVYEVRK